MSSASAQDFVELANLAAGIRSRDDQCRTALIYSIIVDRWCGEFDMRV